jgi:hypothetical protein
MRFYWFLLGTLAVWRVTHLLQAEDGPWDVFVRLRALAGRSFVGALLDCFYCLSVWLAAPLAYWLGESWKEKLLLWPAFSAGAILLERLTGPRESAVAPYFEEPEDHDVLLREGESAVRGSKHRN